MKVHLKHGKVTQIMHGASRNYRCVLDVSPRIALSHLESWRILRRCILSEPSVGYVLGSIHTFHSSQKFKIQMKWEKEPPPPDELIQMARNNVAPQILVGLLKTHINECDHI